MILRPAALALLAALAFVPPAVAMAASVPVGTASLSPAQQAQVQKATAYLQGLTAARSRFVQTDAKGVSRSGVFYIQRPGKARFEYDAPANQRLVADGQFVAVINGSLQTMQKYPLSATPLSLILGKTVRFDTAARITAVRPLDNGGFAITAVAADGKTPGSVTLNFADSPTELIGWSITDATGSTVRVRFDGLVAGPQDSKLFVITDPRPTGMRRN